MLFESMWIALSTYSIIPVPQFEWTERNTKYVICLFPVVGVLCAAALALWHFLCVSLNISGILFAAVAACLPLLITGGIHMDGYMDTVDALASHQSRDWKLEILKDPHCGAFAVIYCVVYVLLSFGLYHEVFSAGMVYAICPAFVFSRGLSALCAVTLHNARKAGMLASFTGQVERKKAVWAIVVLLALSGSAMLWIDLLCGSISLIFCAAVTWWYRRMAMKQFGGVTGDTSGFFLQICELALLAAVWLGGVFG